MRKNYIAEIAERGLPIKLAMQFGSSAQGKPGAFSDEDVLIVVDSDTYQTPIELYQQLGNTPPLIDLVITTTREVNGLLSSLFLAHTVEYLQKAGRLLYGNEDKKNEFLEELELKKYVFEGLQRDTGYRELFLSNLAFKVNAARRRTIALHRQLGIHMLAGAQMSYIDTIRSCKSKVGGAILDALDMIERPRDAPESVGADNPLDRFCTYFDCADKGSFIIYDVQGKSHRADATFREAMLNKRNEFNDILTLDEWIPRSSTSIEQSAQTMLNLVEFIAETVNAHLEEKLSNLN